jgi:hypothetical protein
MPRKTIHTRLPEGHARLTNLRRFRHRRKLRPSAQLPEVGRTAARKKSLRCGNFGPLDGGRRGSESVSFENGIRRRATNRKSALG